ncbi:MAG: Tat pathway signal sequence domain protein [Thioalkalivibrio sp.]|nr:Tat pathway signal sequence domain protein [Thioalkalivibrio sp.]
MRPAIASHRSFRLGRGIALLLIAVWALAPALGLAQNAGSVNIQLNKLEPDGDACRAYIVLENRGEQSFEALRLDLVMFDTDGVIARRLAVDAAPLAAGRTSVRVFAISGLACADIGRVLLNDVLNCAGPDGELRNCMERVTPESIADVPFIK